MGMSKKKVTVGYKYHVGMHMVLCHGPVDSLRRIMVDNKTAWLGNVAHGSISIDAESLFGGESREGGVKGTVDVMSGKSDQTPNNYLQSKLGWRMPSFRGVLSVVLRQVYVGVNPYLKKWSFRVQRIHTRTGGDPQWYSSKAGIAYPLSAVFYFYETFSNGLNGYQEWFGQDGENLGGLEQFDIQGGALLIKGYSGSPALHPSIYKTLPSPGPLQKVRLNVKVLSRNKNDNGLIVLRDANFNSVVGFNAARDSAVDPHQLARFSFSDVSGNSGYSVGTTPLDIDKWYSVLMEYNEVNSSFYVEVRERDTGILHGAREVSVSQRPDIRTVHFENDGGSPPSGSSLWDNVEATVSDTQVDMNPAHIIRECLTDPDWGMGYSEADVDDVSFKACADVLYEEGMGMSLLWDGQISIENFITEVIKHIDAALYVDRFTGKFTLKLIRNDYDKNNLLHLDEYNVDKITDFTKPTFGELTNSVTVNYWDSQTNTNASLTVQDIALAQMQQATINTTVQYIGFTNKYIATLVAQRDLKTLSTPLMSCTIYANTEASELNIGDVFKLTWPDYEVDSVIMRVTGIAYGNGKMNRVRITATQDVFALPDSLIIEAPESEWESPNKPPEPLVSSLIFEVPYLELVQRLGQADIDSLIGANAHIAFLGAAALRPQASAINARFMVNDGPGFEDVGAVDFCPGATLAETLPLVNGAGQIVETVQLENITDEENIEPGEWCQINDEILAVVSLEDGLLTVKRGCLDTVPQKHPSGSTVFFWDAFATDAPTEYVESDQIDVRLLTATGGGVLPLEQAMTTTVEMAGRAARPYPPGDFQINGLYFPDFFQTTEIIELSWSHRDRVQQTGKILIDFTDGNVGPETGVEYIVEAEAFLPDNTSDVYYSENVGDVTYHEIDPSMDPLPEGAIYLEIRVWAERDGLRSLYPQSHGISLLQAPYDLKAKFTE